MPNFLKTIEYEITDEIIKHYASVSGDYNPIHLSKEAANEASFPEKVAHGMLSMAISTKLISPLLLKGWSVSNFHVKFSTPLFVHDKLTIAASLIDQSEKRITIKISGKNQLMERIINGKVELIKLKSELKSSLI